MESLQELLIAELKDIYSAEKQIVKALPKMVKGAQSKELKAAFSEHLEVTKAQVTRVEEVFAAAGAKASAKRCKGMEGILEEGSECLKEEGAGEEGRPTQPAARGRAHRGRRRRERGGGAWCSPSDSGCLPVSFCIGPRTPASVAATVTDLTHPQARTRASCSGRPR